MRKINANFFISLDGVVEAPNEWHFPYFNDEMGAAVSKDMPATEAFLLGRKGYEEWAAFWPSQGEEVPFSSFINGVDKYVVSNSLTQADWQNSTVIPGGSAADGVRELKEQGDGIIAMSGSATLVRWLLAEGLLDQLNLLVHPLAVGKGQRLFEDGDAHALELVNAETFETGVLNLSYVPA